MNWRTFAVALGLLAALLLPASVAAASTSGSFRLADPRIVEASALAGVGPWVATANDSGHAPVVFLLDPRTGRTVGITRLRTSTVDIEALAPAGGNRVWVGDIGDNRHVRRSVTLYRAPVAPRHVLDVRVTPYRLVYPDGPHDAESLFVDRSGRPYIVTKGFTGGAVYRAPYPLSSRHPNRLVRVGRVIELATDATMLPDQRHVLVRSYGIAGVYTFPGFQRIGSFALPRQRQGEGVSAGPGGRVWLGSEGVHTVVIATTLPEVIVQRMRGTASPSPSPTPPPTPSPSSSPSSSGASAPSGAATPTPTTDPPATKHGPAAAARVRQRVPDTVAGGVRRSWLLWSIPLVILLGAAGIGLGLRGRS